MIATPPFCDYAEMCIPAKSFRSVGSSLCHLFLLYPQLTKLTYCPFQECSNPLSSFLYWLVAGHSHEGSVILLKLNIQLSINGWLKNDIIGEMFTN